MARLLIIMGVSGSGKTSLGQLLSKDLKLPFLDADDFHPKQNLLKMSQGISLTDQDRTPWLAALHKQLKMYHKKEGAVLACSALKEKYRVQLSYKLPVEWIFLDGSFDQIYKRMQSREHFMPPALLHSQFDTLEPPKYGLHLNAGDTLNNWKENVLKSQDSAIHFGIIGLGVMGKSLAFNALSKGIPLAVYNRDNLTEAHIVPDFLNEVNTDHCNGFTQLNDFVDALHSPRKILLMVPAGAAVDAVIAQLIPLLNKDDIIIDAGNSHYSDTSRRFESLKKHSINFIGLGVSGGQEGALKGPSFMPGGKKDVVDSLWELTAMAAKVKGEPCNVYMGKAGAGHFVKMIHNGIEYAEMQLLAEVYELLKASNYTNQEIASLLEQWQQSEAESYLLGIMPDILRKQDKGLPLIDLILDVAQGKGTGVWSAKNSLDFGVATTMLTAAVYARFSSTQYARRQRLSTQYNHESTVIKIDPMVLLEAYKTARIVNHLQGFELIQTVAVENNWNTQLAHVAFNWQAGCILKSRLIEQFAEQFKLSEDLCELPISQALYTSNWEMLKTVNTLSIDAMLPLPCFKAALTHLFAAIQKQSSANIIQAQRDYFGAHGYKRNDTDSDDLHHTNWTAK